MKRLFAWILHWATRTYIRRHQPYVIGITGSIGKTTCRMIVTQTLQTLLPDLVVSTSPKNFNSDIGLPLAVLEIDTYHPSAWQSMVTIYVALLRARGKKRYDLLILEYGIDAPGDMQLLTQLVQPEMAIFTGLDKVHAHQLGGPDEILMEKSHLLLSAKEMVFYPIDGEYLGPYLAMIDVDTLSYSLHEDLAHDADIGYVSYQLGRKADEVMTTIHLQQGVENLGAVHSNLIGRNEAGYIALAISIGMILERRLDTHLSTHMDAPVSDLSLTFGLQPGRCSVFRGINDSYLIDSTYNAAPQSVSHMIGTAIQMRQELFPDHELIYCLGDMRELGEFAEREHRSLAAKIAQSADAVYLVGESMRTYLYDELLKLGYNAKRVYGFATSKELGQALAMYLQTDGPALVLLKGSQNTIFLEDALPYLLDDSTDIALLPRQSDWRQQQKSLFYQQLVE